MKKVILIILVLELYFVVGMIIIFNCRPTSNLKPYHFSDEAIEKAVDNLLKEVR